MTKGFLIYEEMRKYFPMRPLVIYDFAKTARLWISFYIRKKFIFFLSVHEYPSLYLGIPPGFSIPCPVADWLIPFISLPRDLFLKTYQPFLLFYTVQHAHIYIAYLSLSSMQYSCRFYVQWRKLSRLKIFRCSILYSGARMWLFGATT
jgi:hypothetical protein